MDTPGRCPSTRAEGAQHSRALLFQLLETTAEVRPGVISGSRRSCGRACWRGRGWVAPPASLETITSELDRYEARIRAHFHHAAQAYRNTSQATTPKTMGTAARAAYTSPPAASGANSMPILRPNDFAPNDATDCGRNSRQEMTPMHDNANPTALRSCRTFMRRNRPADRVRSRRHDSARAGAGKLPACLLTGLLPPVAAAPAR